MINGKNFSVIILPSRASDRYAKYPNGDKPFLAANVVASGWGQEVYEGGTITGPAPLGVFFDATGTTHPDSTIDTFLEIGYHHDFGYATEADAGYWTYPIPHTETSRARCRYVGGAVCGHIYRIPGTYTYSLRAQDSAGDTSDIYVTVVVQDPNTVYSGANTYLCSNDGSSDETNYPGANVWNVTSSGMPPPRSNTRVLFKKDDEYTANLVYPIVATSNANGGYTNVQISNWGSGTNLPHLSKNNYAIYISSNPSTSDGTNPKFPSKFAVSGIKGGVHVPTFCSYLVIEQCDFRNRPNVECVPSYGQDGANLFESVSEGSVVFNYETTSSTSITTGTGSKTLTVGTVYDHNNKNGGATFPVGLPVSITSASDTMTGTVTSYSAPTLIVDVTSATGSNTLSNWDIMQDPPQGIIDRLAGSGLSGQVWPNPRDLHWCDNQMSMLPQGSGDNGTFFAYGMNINQSGNHFGHSGGHQTRLKGGHCVFISHNFYDANSSYTAASVITLRSEKRNPNTADPTLDNTSPPNDTRTVKTLRESGRISTRYVVVDSNEVGKNTYDSEGQTMYLNTQFFNDAVIFKIRDVIYQRNEIYRAVSFPQNEMNFFGGNRITSRDNTTHLSGGSTRGVQVGCVTDYLAAGHYLQSAADYEPYYVSVDDDTSGSLTANGIIVADLISPNKAS